MKYNPLLVVLVMLCSGHSFAQQGDPTMSAGELGYLNIEIFGISINDSIKILEKGDEIPAYLRPIAVLLDQYASKYFAAQVLYRKELGLDFIRQSLSDKYEMSFSPRYKDSRHGRSEKYGVAIQIVEEDEGVNVIYISFKALGRTESDKIMSEALTKAGMQQFIPALTGQED